MTRRESVFDLLRPTSALYASHFRGSIAAYADRLLDALMADDDELSALRDVAAAASLESLYDQFARLQATLTGAEERLSWGRYMSPSALSRWLVAQVDLGHSVGDTAAGIGTVLAMARTSVPTIRAVGVELSQDLVSLAALAHMLAMGSSDSGCEQGDLFETTDIGPLDSLVLSPPWVLRENLAEDQIGLFLNDPLYRPLVRHELFDLCVPFVVESIVRALRVDGSFAATLPSRVAVAPEWSTFRAGKLFQARGVTVAFEFVSPPPEFEHAYPTSFVVCTGRRTA